ncbi:Uncharacterised protein [Mycobacteroides abscessus]|nr:Uncharacterised protein [Mycobacteroides abscessus]
MSCSAPPSANRCLRGNRPSAHRPASVSANRPSPIGVRRRARTHGPVSSAPPWCRTSARVWAVARPGPSRDCSGRCSSRRCRIRLWGCRRIRRCSGRCCPMRSTTGQGETWPRMSWGRPLARSPRCPGSHCPRAGPSGRCRCRAPPCRPIWGVAAARKGRRRPGARRFGRHSRVARPGCRQRYWRTRPDPGHSRPGLSSTCETT